MENIKLIVELICLNGKLVMRLIKKSWLHKYVSAEIEVPGYFYYIKNVKEMEDAMKEIAFFSFMKMKHKWVEFDIDRIRHSQFIGINYGGKIIISSVNEATMISLMKQLNPNNTYVNLNALNEKSVLVDSYITIKGSTATVRAKIYCYNGESFADYSHDYYVPEKYQNYDTKYLSDMILNWFIGDLRARSLKIIMADIEKIDVCEVSNRFSIIEY